MRLFVSLRHTQCDKSGAKTREGKRLRILFYFSVQRQTEHDRRTLRLFFFSLDEISTGMDWRQNGACLYDNI